MNDKIKSDFWRFSGDEEMNTTIGNTAISNQSSSYPGLFRGVGVVRLTSNDHGFKASPQIYGPDAPNCIYVQSTTNYDGMRKIVAVAANTLDIVAKYVAETPAGTEILRPGFKFDHPVQFVGFKVHLSSASATSENLVCAIDADRGAGWDTVLYTKAMNTIADLVYQFSTPLIIPANDIVYFTWANTNDRTWGLEIETKRLS